MAPSDEKTEPKRWLLRPDSRSHVGAGHMARCLALGAALARHVETHAMLDPGGKPWAPKFSQVHIKAGFCQTLEDMPPSSWDGIIVDGYDFSPAYFKRLAEMTPMLVAIDDFLSPPASATMVINPTPGLKGNHIGAVPALLGEGYALIDPAHGDSQPKMVGATVGHIVVSCGMGDPERSNELVVAALNVAFADHPSLSVTVAVGAHVPHLSDIFALASQVDIPVTIKTEVSEMIGLYQSADLVIGAGGVSLLERMACGLPSASLAVADNQRAAIDGAARAGATLNLGEAQDLTPEKLLEELRPLLGEQILRSRMANQARKTVDGRGAERAAAAMLTFAEQKTGANPAHGKDA